MVVVIVREYLHLEQLISVLSTLALPSLMDSSFLGSPAEELSQPSFLKSFSGDIGTEFGIFSVQGKCSASELQLSPTHLDRLSIRSNLSFCLRISPLELCKAA